MAKSTTKAPRVLVNQDAADKAAADTANLAAQKAAREANSASLVRDAQTIVGAYYTADQAVAAAQRNLATKLETAYVALADMASKNDMDLDMSRDVLTAAIEHYYGKGECAIGLSTATKLRSQLLRAMHPNVRANLPGILTAWNTAWDRETKAKAANKDAATPLRDKFDNRDGAITQALKLAQGKTGGKNGKGKVDPVIVTKPADVLSWVREHPRQARGTNAAPQQAVAAATVLLPADATPRQRAEADITGLINAVNEIGSKYPAATDLFADVIAALRKCTAARLVPTAEAAPAPAPAPAPAAPPAEPVAGAAELDAAMVASVTAAVMAALKSGK